MEKYGNPAMSLQTQDVAVAYRAILRRDPQPREERFWTSEAAAKRSFSDLGETLLLQATEVRSISRLYLGMFGRLPDGVTFLPQNNDGLTYWTNLLRAFRAEHRAIQYRIALSYCIEDWFFSEEHKATYPSDLTAEDFADLFAQKLIAQPWGQLDPPADICPPRTKAHYAVAIAECDICKERFNSRINDALLVTANAGLQQ